MAELSLRQQREIVANDLDTAAIKLSVAGDDPRLAQAVERLNEARDIIRKVLDDRPDKNRRSRRNG